MILPIHTLQSTIEAFMNSELFGLFVLVCSWSMR